MSALNVLYCSEGRVLGVLSCGTRPVASACRVIVAVYIDHSVSGVYECVMERQSRADAGLLGIVSGVGPPTNSAVGGEAGAV